MRRLALDMDDVLADTAGKMRGWLADHLGLVVTPEMARGRQMEEYLDPEAWRQLHRAMQAPDFFEDIPPIPGSREMVADLAQRHEIFIASAAMEFPNSFSAKFTWLRRHFAFIDPMNYLFCGDKSIVRADVLVDDNARNFKGFHGVGILFDAPHNSLVEGHLRARDWGEVGLLLATS